VIECCVGKTETLDISVAPMLTSYSAVEFIHLLSSEANEICEKESKKTIAPEHIISALQVLLSLEIACSSPDRGGNPRAWVSNPLFLRFRTYSKTTDNYKRYSVPRSVTI
jgi:hypothetical protein